MRSVYRDAQWWVILLAHGTCNLCVDRIYFLNYLLSFLGRFLSSFLLIRITMFFPRFCGLFWKKLLRLHHHILAINLVYILAFAFSYVLVLMIIPDNEICKTPHIFFTYLKRIQEVDILQMPVNLIVSIEDMVFKGQHFKVSAIS